MTNDYVRLGDTVTQRRHTRPEDAHRWKSVVVIDPEDHERVTELAAELIKATCRAGLPWEGSVRERAAVLRDTLREFAATPPKPEEPTGLGAVVVDAEGRRWIRVDWENPWCLANPVRRANGSPTHGSHVSYDRINAVRVLSEGAS